MLAVQVLWGCRAFNATPEQAARMVCPGRTVILDFLESCVRDLEGGF
jgi:hypothetical protein